MAAARLHPAMRLAAALGAVAAVACLLAAPPARAAATPLLYTQADANGMGQEVWHGGNDAVNQAASDGNTHGNFPNLSHDPWAAQWSVFAYAAAAYGTLGAQAQISSVGDNIGVQTYALASAKFDDWLTITDPSQALGSWGHLLLPVQLHGAYGVASSSGQVAFGLTVGGVVIARGSTVDGGLDTLNSLVLLPWTFRFGTPFELRAELTVGANDHAMGAANLFLDASHTAKFTGIDQVWAGYSGSANPLSSFTITSASGTDYGAGAVVGAVPEPATALLLAIGVAGLAATRRRQPAAVRAA